MKPLTTVLLQPGPDHDEVRITLQRILEPHFQFESFPKPATNRRRSISQMIDDAGKLGPALVFLELPSDSLLQSRTLFQMIREAAAAPIVAIVEDHQPGEIFELLDAGADDFVTMPLQPSDVLPRAWKLSRPGMTVKPRMRAEPALQHLIGESPVFVEQVQKIPQIAACAANVLITGETGTGKELYARAIHYCSARAGRPFMPVNCGAIPTDLVENELFGHERGAFTSAVTLQTGLIEEANGGTLFLDEIDCLPTFAQVKLLRFLQDKEYRPLGSARTRRADVRVIAASNVDLEEAVGNGRVRQDLFYRLNIISLTLPPLRERLEDVPLLARHFLNKYSREMDKQAPDLEPAALHALMAHPWPGNIRELEHAIERATVLCKEPLIRGVDLILGAPPTERQSLRQAKATQIARFEKSYIQGLLRACRGNISKAARVAQKNRRAFWQLIQKHHIDVERFRSSSPL